MNEKYCLTVCTLGDNPQLIECINALVQLKLNSQYLLEVLVVVNSERIDLTLPEGVTVIFEPQRGYSSVRNRAISAIPNGANVIFLDDDEIPSTEWLNALVTAHLNYPDDVIAGPVYPEHRNEQISYRGLASMKYSKFEDDSFMKQAPTANMLIPGRLIQEELIHFDEIFNFSGSEDTDLCFRLRKYGIKIRFTKNAILFERQKPERYDPDYLKKRKLRDISNYSLVVRRNSNPLAIFWRFSTLIFRIAVFGVWGIFEHSARENRRIYYASLCVLLSGKPQVI